MKFAALAGGIGCGKSAVSALVAERGAIVLDVDLINRELQQPGRPVFEAMVDRWGAAIVAEDGTLDRQAVADRVFSDRAEMAALGAITSPAMEDEIYDRAGAYHGTERLVILEAALLAGAPGMYGTKGLLVVDAPEELVIERLVRQRGMAEADARARMANQPPREQRIANADFLIDNTGSPKDLDAQVDRAWEWLVSLPDGVVIPRM